MATQRERPYVQFNFLVDLKDGSGEDQAFAGFQECSGIGMEVTVAEYRNGNEKDNNVRKITGLNKASDVTLKRGIMGTKTLYSWLDAIRSGDNTSDQALRSVTVKLQSEDHNTVMTWTLNKARIIKYTCGPLNAKGTDIAMEEMVLAYERLTME